MYFVTFMEWNELLHELLLNIRVESHFVPLILQEHHCNKKTIDWRVKNEKSQNLKKAIKQQ